MKDGLDHDISQLRKLCRITAGDEARAGIEHQGDGIERGILGSPGCGASPEALIAQRAGLSRRQAVNGIMVQEDGHIDVALGREYHVLDALSEGGAVALKAYHREIGVRYLYALRCRYRPTVQRIESRQRQIVEYLAVAADPGGHDKTVPSYTEALEPLYCVLDCLEYAEIAAADAPGVRGKGAQIVHQITSFSRSDSSFGSKGLPSYRLMT